VAWHAISTKQGTIPEGEPTPTVTLGLQPGELVRIKPYQEILKTLNTRNHNRGLYFDAEEVPYCGGTYRVFKRVTKIIHERTGKMLEMKTPCVILESVVCQSAIANAVSSAQGVSIRIGVRFGWNALNPNPLPRVGENRAGRIAPRTGIKEPLATRRAELIPRI